MHSYFTEIIKSPKVLIAEVAEMFMSLLQTVSIMHEVK